MPRKTKFSKPAPGSVAAPSQGIGTPDLLNKQELKNALNLSSVRIIDEWVRRRMISFYRLGHRTLKFSLAQVLEDLGRFEVKAVGRKNK